MTNRDGKFANTSHNFGSAFEAKIRLEKLVNTILPSCEELYNILKQKRKARKYDQGSRSRFNDSEFPFDDENIIYIVALKILESYHLEFSQNETVDQKSNYYAHRYLPLALEFYKNHANQSDLILVSSLIRYLNVYFPNLQQ